METQFLTVAGQPVAVADLRGSARGVALFYMRAASCSVCRRHVRALAALGLRDRGVVPAVVVPGGPGQADRVRRAVGAGVTVVSSGGVDAHRAAGLSRTLLMQHSGTVLV